LESLAAKNLSKRSTQELQNNSFTEYNESFNIKNSVYKFNKIGTVSFSQFLAEQKNKAVYISNRDYCELSFKDRNVGFGETFGYYVQLVTKQLGAPFKSDEIYITIDDFAIPAPPLEVTIKKATSWLPGLSIRVLLDDNPYAAKILVQKRSSDERQINFEFLPDLPISGKSLIFADPDVISGMNYYYRFFVQNIFGRISLPLEVASSALVQGNKNPAAVIQKATSIIGNETIKSPVLSTAQDENSDHIKVSISPNDPLILYYAIDRMDTTINERDFTVPSNTYTGYGGSGWVTDKFFVEKTVEVIDSSPTSYLAKTLLKEITFIDTTTVVGHTYQYRARGYDLAGNGGPYSFSFATTAKKKSIRSPINLKIEILRKFPLRVKISWDDDNAGSPKEVRDNIQFQVARRPVSQNYYEYFPLTKNNFIIDEVATLDAIGFEKMDLSGFGTEISGQTELIQASKLRRSTGLPAFLESSFRYLYKVSARVIQPAENFISEDLITESNYSSELEFWALTEVSTPVDLIGEAISPKVKPNVIRLSWTNKKDRLLPDNWLIERKSNSVNELFKIIGKTYLENEYLDYEVKPGSTYVYRVTAFDSIGRASDPAEISVVV
jgi:hypothetical protein